MLVGKCHCKQMSAYDVSFLSMLVGKQRDDKDIERKASPDLGWISKFHKGRIGPINIT